MEGGLGVLAAAMFPVADSRLHFPMRRLPDGGFAAHAAKGRQRGTLRLVLFRPISAADLVEEEADGGGDDVAHRRVTALQLIQHGYALFRQVERNLEPDGAGGR